jgi:hypothetical protein
VPTGVLITFTREKKMFLKITMKNTYFNSDKCILIASCFDLFLKSNYIILFLLRGSEFLRNIKQVISELIFGRSFKVYSMIIEVCARVIFYCGKVVVDRS